MLRFYLKQKENIKGPLISIFVGNLPNGLSQIQYEKILFDNLKNNNGKKVFFCRNIYFILIFIL
jgi:hypothetical protein